MGQAATKPIDNQPVTNVNGHLSVEQEGPYVFIKSPTGTVASMSIVDAVGFEATIANATRVAACTNACLGIPSEHINELGDGVFKKHIEEWAFLQESHNALLGALKLAVHATKEGSALRKMCDEVIQDAEKY